MAPRQMKMPAKDDTGKETEEVFSHKHDVLDKREEQAMAGGTAETKAAKFSRLASARVRRAVKAINLVGALASAQYEKTPAQVDKIETYLNAAVRAAVARLRGEAEADNTIEI